MHSILLCFNKGWKTLTNLCATCILSGNTTDQAIVSGQLTKVSCRYTLLPVICSQQLPYCHEDFPLNDVTVYLDYLFDRAIDFPIFLLKFVDQNAQNQGKLLVIIKHNTNYLFSAISNFLMH